MYKNGGRSLALHTQMFRRELLRRNHSTSLEIRIAQHNDGTFEGYTASRRPVELIFSQWFDQITDAIESERKLKGWSRAKKEALIRGDFALLKQLAKRKSPYRGATAGG